MIGLQIIFIIIIVILVVIIRRAIDALFRVLNTNSVDFDSLSTQEIDKRTKQAVLLIGVIISLSMFVVGFIILVGESSKL